MSAPTTHPLLRPFTEHPTAVGETYTQHMGMAYGYAFRLGAIAIAAAIHGLLPFLFQTTASDTIIKMNTEIQARRKMASTGDEAAAEVGSAPSA